MRDLEEEKQIKAYMEAKMTHIKMYNECMNLADGLDVEKFAELVRADEREACAKLVEADGRARGNEGLVLIKAAGRIRARSENLPVKSYCGGKANYCTPEVTPDVDAVNMSQERVDETAKREHEPWQSVQCTCGGTIYFKHTKREWVGLDGEIPGLGLVTEEFYNGMIFAEDILRERNGG